jgi:hypothetical protein
VRADGTSTRENRLEDGLSKLNSAHSCNPVPLHRNPVPDFSLAPACFSKSGFGVHCSVEVDVVLGEPAHRTDKAHRARLEVRHGNQIHRRNRRLRSKSSGIPRKEVIQPQLPLRLPCYDFTPIIDPTFDGSLPCGLGHRLRVLPTFVV